MSDSEKWYGVYSQTAADMFGDAVYNTPSGERVLVTAIYKDPEATSYQWDDKVLVGEVTTIVEGRWHNYRNINYIING